MSKLNTRHCSVMFVDLRGSTALFLQLGNAQATTLVTQKITLLSNIIQQGGGVVIKTLGDGLMAIFERADCAANTAKSLQQTIGDILPSAPPEHDLLRLKFKIALTWGEIVDVAGDCYGDAVNLAARVLDLAGDQETLVTDTFVAALPTALKQEFRPLDRLHIRGRAEPVGVLRLTNSDFSDTTLIQPNRNIQNPTGSTNNQTAIKLLHNHAECVYSHQQLPLLLGRHPQANVCIDRSHVSRSHAKIEGQNGHYDLVDLSYNGTYLQFDHDRQVLLLRREHCTLHGNGYIWLGAPPGQASVYPIRFEIFNQTEHAYQANQHAARKRSQHHLTTQI